MRYISIQTLCNEMRNRAQVHTVSIDHPWDVPTSWLESTCGKFNWLDMIWSHSWKWMSEQKLSHEVEGIVRRAPRQYCVAAQIWGREPKNCQKPPKGLSNHEKQDYLDWWNQDWTLSPECQASHLEETWHHPYGEAWWWQHHAVGMFFSGRDWETSQDRVKDEWSKVQRDPWWKPSPEC